MYPCDEHIFIVRAIKDPDQPGFRQRSANSPQEAVRELGRSRGLEGGQGHPLRVHRSHDMPCYSPLPRGIHTLQYEQDRAGAPAATFGEKSFLLGSQRAINADAFLSAGSLRTAGGVARADLCEHAIWAKAQECPKIWIDTSRRRRLSFRHVSIFPALTPLRADLRLCKAGDMHRHAVWAPQAESLELVLDPGTAAQSTNQLTHSGGGWWRLDGLWAEHGSDYAYRIDGGELLPDPRSAWQPNGVHGPSRVFDPQIFHWTDERWRGPQQGRGVRGAVLYELHLGTFTPEGTFAAAAAKLPHLIRLGVDLVQLMPVTGFPGRWGWGYDSVHTYAVHEPYGGPAGLQEFVAAAHDLGLGVGLDMVYNHLGPCGNYLPQFGPYFTDKYSTPWGPAVNIDGPDSSAVRRWIIDNALRWFRDFHIDALRLDAVHELRDASATHILAQLSEETRMLSAALGRPLDLIAESDLNDPRTIEPTAEDGLGMSAQWADDIHHALHAVLTGERQGYYFDFGSLAVLATTLTRVFRHAGNWSTFRNRNWGRPVDPTRHSGQAFVASLQTHDQIGNRATGERIGHLVTPAQQAIGAALLCTSAFTPMLFMGEEWSTTSPWQYFTDFDDPQLAAAVRDGRRREFTDHGWSAESVPDPQDPATRQRSVLRWDELAHANRARMFDWYRALLHLRRQHPELRDPQLAQVQVEFDEEEQWLTMRRADFLVVALFADQAAVVPLTAEPVDVLLCWDPATTALRTRSVALGAHGVAILRTDLSAEHS